MHRTGVSLLAYSPLGFGMLTGKYDEAGFDGPTRRPGPPGALRPACASSAGAAPEALAAARRYNALAREHGLTPTRMALAFCYTQLARGQHASSA